VNLRNLRIQKKRIHFHPGIPWIFLHAKGVAELLVFSGRCCNQLDPALKETM